MVVEDGLHILSWNVAGWKRTVEQISRQRGGLGSFLERHHADILCLQETKVTAKAIADESRQLGAELAGYETFWACNAGTAGQRQGLNGVATFAKAGSVLRADPAPLGSADLDGEGRCLLTDHGTFVLFNAYVPNSAGGTRLPFKLRWLNALRAAMCRTRAAGKAVILAGDLNMKHRPTDSYWADRRVSFRALSDLAQSEAAAPDVHTAAASAVAEWPSLCSALSAREICPLETRNSQTGRSFEKWAVFVESKAGDRVRLGGPIDTQECAGRSFFLNGVGCEEDGTIVLGHASELAPHVLSPPGQLPVGDLVECLKKISCVEFSMKVQRGIADAIGVNLTAPGVLSWLSAVLNEDGMVDSFAQLHPTAEERFTCWDQYRNKRQENVGARIDYILVDRTFFAKHVKQGLALYSGDPSRAGAPSPESAAAALAAATLGGLLQPAPFNGGGLEKLTDEEYVAQFRSGPSSGIVYTPAQLSDHVAVSLLLQGLPAGAPSQAAKRSTSDASTRSAQPHKAGRRITDFFAKKRGAEEATSKENKDMPPFQLAEEGALPPEKQRKVLVLELSSD
eukprot:gnl/TRDRNA2_/TRDRNA2_66206_c0_seq1.p1 gnl/TRDRNA2_/TRDRNA2_66206_c0~~gnl/TRDRNA2_/TRDRNA2_66206_c0_seq1.p1  ORF type:complete len:579 (-),score=94.12 gnl/TRDRNA2_/TRDRNA2_66206_c0_seq1:45-1745(-)